MRREIILERCICGIALLAPASAFANGTWTFEDFHNMRNDSTIAETSGDPAGPFTGYGLPTNGTTLDNLAAAKLSPAGQYGMRFYGRGGVSGTGTGNPNTVNGFSSPGDNDYSTGPRPYSDWYSSNDFTLTAFLRPTVIHGAAGHGIGIMGNYNGNFLPRKGMFVLGAEPDGRVFFAEYYTSGSNQSAQAFRETNVPVLENNLTTHIAVRKTGSTVDILVNGSAVPSDLTSSGAFPNAPLEPALFGLTPAFWVGGGALPTFDWTEYTGDMDDVAVFGTALSNQAIQDIVTNGIVTIPAGTSIWNANSDGNWLEGSNWQGGVPNAVDAIARFGSSILAPHTVTLSDLISVGAIQFDNANSYTLAGTGPLVLDVSHGQPTIDVTNGSHTISVPLILNIDTTINVVPVNSTLTVSGSVDATGKTISKMGAGAVQFDNVRAAGLNVNAGTVRISSKGSFNSPSGTSSVQSLSIAGGSTPTAALDMTNNSLIVDYDGSSPINTIRDQLKSGFSNGSWNGNGITSSAAAAASVGAHKTALGYAEATALGGSEFGGQPITGDALVIAYTLSGDANLDGRVNALDFNSLASNFGGASKVWLEGDFNYDGTVDSADFNTLASNFNMTLSSLAPTLHLGAVVPEPGGLAMLLLSAGGMRRTQRRKAAR